MHSLTSLLLVPFMALLIGILESSGAQEYTEKNLFSEEAKNTMKELNNYINKLDEAFDEFGNQLKQENYVYDALRAYRELYESSKKTCKGEKLPIEDDEDLLDSFIEECVNSLPVGELAAFNNKIKVSKVKVKAIDETLKENAETWDSNQTSSEENKKKALEDLNSVLSAEVKAEFENDAHKVLAHAKKHVEECFTKESDELLSDIEDATNNINACLSKISQ